jgi:hypothetical protein
MSYIIGRGRNARETYPDRPSSSSGAIIRVGYDAIVEEFDLAEPGSPTYLPRNVALDPVQVTFPAFALGNTLEVDFKLNGIWSSETPGPSTVQTQIAVSLDGGVTFYTLSPSTALAEVDVNANNVVLLRSLDAIRIVDPMPVVVNGFPGTIPVTSPPIVRVFYTSDEGSVLLNGSVDELTLPGAILKCSELAAASVFQGPLGQLAITT